MNKIKNQIDKIDKRKFRSNKIQLHLHHPELKQHYVLFGYYKEKSFLQEDIAYCHILSSPSLTNKALSYTDISIIEIDLIDEYYGDFEIIENSKYLHRNYKKVEAEFKKLEG